MESRTYRRWARKRRAEKRRARWAAARPFVVDVAQWAVIAWLYRRGRKAAR